MNLRTINEFAGLRLVCAAAVTAFVSLAAASPASSQNVVVDLGAIDGGPRSGGPYGAPGPGGYYADDGYLLFPPSASPQSRLEGPLTNGYVPQARAVPPSAPMSRLNNPGTVAGTVAGTPGVPLARAVPPGDPMSRIDSVPTTSVPMPEPATQTARQPSPPAAPQRRADLPPPPEPAPARAPEPAPEPESAPTMAAAPEPAPEPAPTPVTPAPPQVTAPPPPPSTAEAPVSAPAAAPPPPPTQTASLTETGSANETRILFEPGSPDLNDAARATLDALAEKLRADESLRIQLQAFAAGTDESAPEARRLSLKRALNVRGHLVEQNVRNTRMDVRALGIKSGDGPADRVDAVIVQR